MRAEHVSAIEKAIRDLHGAEPVFRTVALVRETFQGQPVWEGPVYVFDLKGHETAQTVYGLACPVDGSDRTEFTTILGEGPIISPLAAVRAYVSFKARGSAAGS